MVLEKTLESPLDGKEIQPVNPKRNQLSLHWRDCCRREELPHAPTLEARGSGQEELPLARDRDGSREEQPHIQGAMAARVQEGLEELSHVEDQEAWP